MGKASEQANARLNKSTACLSAAGVREAAAILKANVVDR